MYLDISHTDSLYRFRMVTESIRPTLVGTLQKPGVITQNDCTFQIKNLYIYIYVYIYVIIYIYLNSLHFSKLQQVIRI